MKRFRVGDKVILANQNGLKGKYSIPDRHWGKEYYVVWSNDFTNDYYIGRDQGGDAEWSVYDDMLEPVVMSEFHRKVREYINKELKI